jgi:hypothetical protein
VVVEDALGHREGRLRADVADVAPEFCREVFVSIGVCLTGQVVRRRIGLDEVGWSSYEVGSRAYAMHVSGVRGIQL